MISFRLQAVQQTVHRLFPERHIYLRSGVETKAFVLSTTFQATVAATAGAAGLWLVAATAAILLQPMLARADEQTAIRTKNYYERLIADRQARLDTAVAQLSGGKGGVKGVAEEIARRHTALAMLLTELRGAPGAATAIAPITVQALNAKSPVDEIRAVQADQERMVGAAEDYARSRAERLRMAFRLAGLDAAAAGRSAGGEGLGGPLLEAKDPRTLAAVLDVDTDFASRIQHAAHDLTDAQTLGEEAEKLPLAKPVVTPVKTSGFGARIDPFTHHGAFHPGQDFAGAFMTSIQSTAPGVVSFTGQRNGYGNVVEIDHGRGLKTRYAHLQAISVAMGQKVGVGQRIGAMGSTGRSTGVHLHYEVWENGRVQDPTRFLKAGDYVQQNN
jgi:murein DD-endopeptidase MepM/ murein hydrolase activator NlpD